MFTKGHVAVLGFITLGFITLNVWNFSTSAATYQRRSDPATVRGGCSAMSTEEAAMGRARGCLCEWKAARRIRVNLVDSARESPRERNVKNGEDSLRNLSKNYILLR